MPLFGSQRAHLAALAVLTGACTLSACGDPNRGVDPPADQLFFPGGLLLDPRTPDGSPAKYLLVSNGNNDLSFNAGTVTALDLEAFFASWKADDGFFVHPFCEPGRCVLDVGTTTSAERPCRRLGLLPHIAECDEGEFVVDGARVGDFATTMVASDEGDRAPRLWLPVRGDPSITFLDVLGDPDLPPDLSCGQGRDASGRWSDTELCTEPFKLTHLRNDPELTALGREPFNMLITEAADGSYRYGVVAHAGGGVLTLIDLDGLTGDQSKPAIIDSEVLFTPTVATDRSGAFGLALRACDSELLDPQDLGSANAPSRTRGCTRPLIYGTYRFQPAFLSLTASGLDSDDLPEGAMERTSCWVDEQVRENFVGAYCAGPQDIGEQCALLCEPGWVDPIRTPVAIVDPFSSGGSARPVLGDMVFTEDGNELYIVQTNPGALLRVDTSLGLDNEPFDIGSGPPLELCDQPTRMKIWAEQGLAFISCFQAAYVYVVDLRAWRVVSAVITGTGPHDLELDPVREMLYVANTLEGSISVVDLGRDRSTRFQEVARIGLQEPFSR